MTIGILPRSGRSTTVILDTTERLTILLLYAWLIARIARSMTHGGQVANVLLLISEGLVVVFLLTRRMTSEVSRNPTDWLLAIFATCGPLLVNTTEGTGVVSPAVAAGLWLAGTLVQVSAKLALGRSFGCVAAHRGLKQSGPYHFLRHPMYAGYMISHVAFLLMNPTTWNIAVYALCDVIQIPRILAEERLLSRDPAYQAYCAEVKWRVLPGLF